MTTLYIDRKELEIRMKGRALTLSDSDGLKRTVPLSMLRRIVIRGDVSITTGVLGRIADEGIAVLMLTGRQHQRCARLYGSAHGDAGIRLAQYRAAQEDDFRRYWSGRLVLSKLLGQLRFLRQLKRVRPDRVYPLSQGIGTLEKCIRSLKEAPPDSRTVSSLMGLEGAAASAYFSAYSTVFAPTLMFSDRNRRPPKDPVNSCLSLGYTLLHHEAARYLFGAGLDPQLGIYHEIAYGRESLASDVIEPLRWRVDRWVWERFRSQELKKEDFTMDNEACLLKKAGRQRYYAGWESFVVPIRRLLRLTGYRVAANLVKEGAGPSS